MLALLPDSIDVFCYTYLLLRDGSDADGQFSGTQLRFSYKNVHRMISVQYAIVIMVLVLSAGICRQMNMMENTQTGGDSRDVMVMRGLTEPYMEKFPLLRDKIAGSTLLQGMTTCFQIPGEAIRDHINVRCGGGSDWVDLPVMVAGDDFIGFHEIPLLAGDGFAPLQYDLQQEVSMMMEFYESSAPSDRKEEYIINAGAMRALGFSSPDDAVGRPLEIRHGSLGYISRGVVAGVTDDYNYTGLFEETTPLVMLHRNLFQFVLMVRLDASRPEEAMRALDAVWAEVYPDCESDFVPMSDIFRNQYRNELNARNLVLTFTLLCFLVADLGLIVLPEPESSSWSFRCCRYRSRAGMQQEPIRPTVSENSIQQMPDCSHRMIQQHPRPRPPHDGPDALPHVGTVAVDRASAACGLIV